MIKTLLNGTWLMQGNNYEVEGKIPGSVYSFLLDKDLMPDPYYRNNELIALEIADHDYSFERKFNYKLSNNQIFLVCEGLDTVADIYINGKLLSSVDNMFITYRFNVTEFLTNGENVIKIAFKNPIAYAKQFAGRENGIGQSDAMLGHHQVRKEACSYGWDWGPHMPDSGIWRDIYLLEKNSQEITDFEIIQRHENGKVYVTAKVTTDEKCQVNVTVKTPNGETFTVENNKETLIENAELWFPNGMGKQPLYTFTAQIVNGNEVVDSKEKRVGLRVMKLIRERDEYGQSFYHEINGYPMFAMGADYIPEDNVLSRITPERSRVLLEKCVFANFNTIRVWGGGYYPDDWFFDLCDELGLVVFLDLMFACSVYDFNEKFKNSVLLEVEQNLKRIRHHACIGLISGNNECEEAMTWSFYSIKDAGKFATDYIEMFERRFPKIIEKVCPYIPYSSASPTSLGNFVEPQNENYGDTHYWRVWHSGDAYQTFRDHYFRYLSEFGFQSFPCLKTVQAFTTQEDRNIFSRTMERHQRNGAANGKIMNYMYQTFKYPTDFDTLLYASQLLQAEAMRYGVEHLRQNRGRCMGTLYWQLNDIWPVASWASIDYYGRLKALHYVAKRFYSPILLSCEETGEMTSRKSLNVPLSEQPYKTSAKFAVTNDTLNDINGVITYEVRNNLNNKVILSDNITVSVPKLSALKIDEIEFEKIDVNNHYLYFYLTVDGEMVSEGTAVFTAYKFFNFKNPLLRVERNGNELTVYSDSFAKYVEISCQQDIILSDNYFDMVPGKKVIKISDSDIHGIKIRSVYDIK